MPDVSQRCCEKDIPNPFFDKISGATAALTRLGIVQCPLLGGHSVRGGPNHSLIQRNADFQGA